MPWPVEPKPPRPVEGPERDDGPVAVDVTVRVDSEAPDEKIGRDQ